MNDDYGEEETEPQSKFEWRPEDITILTDEDTSGTGAECPELLEAISGESESK